MPHCWKSRVGAHILICPSLAGVHAPIQGFYSGGRGIQVRRPENSLDNVFFFVNSNSEFFFTVNRGGPMVLLQRKLYFSKDPEGVQLFPYVNF